VSNFSATPFVVAESQLIAMIPSTLAARFAHLPGIRLHASPAEFPSYPVSMAWHPRVHAEPGHRWLRQLVIDAAHRLAPSA
jgi:DNA-binding transcriptional LysR family regulator